MCVRAPCTWDNKCVHVCTLYVASTATGSVGCSRPLLYCEDECVRVCTLYVG